MKLTPAQRDEVGRCIIDGPWYWLQNYVHTFDKPRNRTRKYPGWPYLKDYVNELHNREKIRQALVASNVPEDEISIPQQNLIVEKSRDMMITWTTAAYMTYCVSFIPDWSGFTVSRRQNEVDDGGEAATTDSIFGMIRFIWSNIPDWMRADLAFSLLKIRNIEQDMNSYITGESANPNAGRGKSVSFKWADEFAFMPQSNKMHAAMSGGNYGTLLYTSTANFAGNEFYDLRHNPNSGFKILTFRYTMRPDRDEAWGEKKRLQLGDIRWATEYGILYEFTTDRNVFPRYSPSIHTVQHEDMVLEGEPYVGFDEGMSDPGCALFCLKDGDMLKVVDEVYEKGIHPRVTDDLRDSGVTDWMMIVEGLCRKYGFEPKDVTVCIGHTSGMEGLADHFKLAKFKTHTADKDKIGRIRILDRLMIYTGLNKPRLQISKQCEKLMWELPRFERAVVNGQIMEYPRKHSADHACDGLMAVAQYLFPDEVFFDDNNWSMDAEDWDTVGVLGDEKTVEVL